MKKLGAGILLAALLAGCSNGGGDTETVPPATIKPVVSEAPAATAPANAGQAAEPTAEPTAEPAGEPAAEPNPKEAAPSPGQGESASSAPSGTPESKPGGGAQTAAPAAGIQQPKPQPSEAASKADYLQKLDAIKEGLADLQPLYDEGTTASMREAAAEEYTRWDTALNEIYAELKHQLSKSAMDKLRQAQREWILHRDATAKKESAEFRGGSMEPVQYVSTQARVTQERCYELVEQYMK
ncbi:lysozyme inhibitor LprI family protein [Paenibacillus sp. CN-4]|uniref:lysozyme inhibitor LprI family protein n=1 Tax=Paenibacillus nanchangensis TaxID=3348343 RepID=UPI00397ACE00